MPGLHTFAAGHTRKVMSGHSMVIPSNKPWGMATEYHCRPLWLASSGRSYFPYRLLWDLRKFLLFLPVPSSCVLFLPVPSSCVLFLPVPRDRRGRCRLHRPAYRGTDERPGLAAAARPACRREG
eukprot:gene13976-biopygen3592